MLYEENITAVLANDLKKLVKTRIVFYFLNE